MSQVSFGAWVKLTPATSGTIYMLYVGVVLSIMRLRDDYRTVQLSSILQHRNRGARDMKPLDVVYVEFCGCMMFQHEGEVVRLGRVEYSELMGSTPSLDNVRLHKIRHFRRNSGMKQAKLAEYTLDFH